jgi:hypothetical protein
MEPILTIIENHPGSKVTDSGDSFLCRQAVKKVVFSDQGGPEGPVWSKSCIFASPDDLRAKANSQ